MAIFFRVILEADASTILQRVAIKVKFLSKTNTEVQTLDSNAEVCGAIFSLLFGCRWQKCWDVFSYIKKKQQLPPTPPKMLNFEQNRRK